MARDGRLAAAREQKGLAVWWRAALPGKGCGRPCGGCAKKDVGGNYISETRLNSRGDRRDESISMHKFLAKPALLHRIL